MLGGGTCLVCSLGCVLHVTKDLENDGEVEDGFEDTRLRFNGHVVDVDAVEVFGTPGLCTQISRGDCFRCQYGRGGT